MRSVCYYHAPAIFLLLLSQLSRFQSLLTSSYVDYGIFITLFRWNTLSDGKNPQKWVKYDLENIARFHS